MSRQDYTEQHSMSPWNNSGKLPNLGVIMKDLKEENQRTLAELQRLREDNARLKQKEAELVDKFRDLLQQIDSTPKRTAGYHELYCIQFDADMIDRLRKDFEVLAKGGE